MRRWLRSLWTSIWFGGLTCITCGRRRIGYTRYCEQHAREVAPLLFAAWDSQPSSCPKCKGEGHYEVQGAIIECEVCDGAGVSKAGTE